MDFIKTELPEMKPSTAQKIAKAAGKTRTTGATVLLNRDVDDVLSFDPTAVDKPIVHKSGEIEGESVNAFLLGLKDAGERLKRIITGK